MSGGYTGKILVINLDNHTFDVEDTNSGIAVNVIWYNPSRGGTRVPFSLSVVIILSTSSA